MGRGLGFQGGGEADQRGRRRTMEKRVDVRHRNSYAVCAHTPYSHAFCRTCLALEQERAIPDSRERRVRAEGVSRVLLEMGRLEGRGRMTEAEEDHGEDKTRSAKLGGQSAQQ